MACQVTIDGVFGLGSGAAQLIRVAGTAQECAGDIDGDGSVIVGLSCRSPNGPFDERVAVVDGTGQWQAFFPPPQGCDCDQEVFATARCATDDDCQADLFTGTITCVSCPVINFGGDDDVGFPHVRVGCDIDGTALVMMTFDVENATPNIVVVRVNCGPGGTPVDNTPTALTPGTVETMTVVCRYNPDITKNPTPFIEFTDLAGNPQGCPPQPIPVGTLPECPPGCPSTAVLEVRNSDGNTVDLGSVQCLPPGTYTVAVTQPLELIVSSYSWSVGGMLQQGATASTLDVALGAGESIAVAVAVTVRTCPAVPVPVTLKGCVDQDACETALAVEVRNAAGQVVDLDQDCVVPGTYTIAVLAPTGPGWTFKWGMDGVVDQMTNGPSYQVNVVPGQTTAVTIVAENPACLPKSTDLTLKGCGDSGDGGVGLGCAGMLIAAVTALIVGAILTAAGICIGNPILVGLGASTLLIGVVLFGLWMALCRRLTSCNVMNKLRCLLARLAVLALLIGLLLVLSGQGIVCGLAAAAAAGPWALAAELLEDALDLKGCERTVCLLPGGD